MSCKQIIIEMIQKINNENNLKRLYKLVSYLYLKE